MRFLTGNLNAVSEMRIAAGVGGSSGIVSGTRGRGGKGGVG